MSIAFLEGAEYAAVTEEATSIDYAERYDDERLAQGYDDLVFQMRDDLITAINELRSQLAEATRLLEVAHDRIAELEAQLAATLTTIEAAANDGVLYAEGCQP